MPQGRPPQAASSTEREDGTKERNSPHGWRCAAETKGNWSAVARGGKRSPAQMAECLSIGAARQRLAISLEQDVARLQAVVR